MTLGAERRKCFSAPSILFPIGLKVLRLGAYKKGFLYYNLYG